MATQIKTGHAQGFTLPEMLIAASLMSLIFLGAMTLLLSASRATVRTQAQVFATNDAANAITTVIGEVREARTFALPSDGTDATKQAEFVLPPGTFAAQFTATLGGNPLNTAIEISAPSELSPDTNGYEPNASKVIRVQSTTGGYWAVQPYQVTGPTGTVSLLYRGDPDGAPDPDPTGSPKKGAGTYLWQYDIPSDGTFNTAAHPPVALCKTISAAPNAVQFVRPVSNNKPEAWQVEIKIISGYYSPINSQQTSEEGNGASTSQLSGKCVYMRNHSPSAATSVDASTRNTNNVFQYQ